MTALLIDTPEGIRFSLPVAGPVPRFAAWLIDLFCVLAAFSFARRAAGILAPLDPDLVNALQTALFFVIHIGYAITLEWRWRGQTVGKRLIGLRVVDADGLRLRSSQIVLRNLLRVVDALPLAYAVGGLTAILSSKAQRLGDIAAGTVVIYGKKAEIPDLEQVLRDEYNTLLDHAVLVARLRKGMDTTAAELALDAVLRREELDEGARLELFRELADYFRSITRFPDSVAVLSNERLVRNVVDLLFRRSDGRAH